MTDPLPQFDRIATAYRWAEYLSLGTLLKGTRELFLPTFRNCRQALLLGDGDGRFAAALLRSAPGLQAHAVDGSAAMLALLRRRCERNGTSSRLSTEHGSVLETCVMPHTDVIVTHFVLDCLTQAQVDRLTHKLAAEVQPGCLWVVSEFGYPQGTLLRMLGRIYLRLLYGAFRVLTGLRPQHLPDPAAALLTAGWHRLERRERLRGLLYAELWERG